LAAEWKLSDLTPMEATRAWSNKYSAWKAQSEDHPLDGDWFNGEHRKSAFAIDFTQASFFVHCTQPSLDNFFPAEGVPFEIKPSSRLFVDARGSVFFLLLNNLHLIVRYVLYGLNLDSPVVLNNLFSKILQNTVSIDVVKAGN
jgi:hypothetical protein